LEKIVSTLTEICYTAGQQIFSGRSYNKGLHVVNSLSVSAGGRKSTMPPVVTAEQGILGAVLFPPMLRIGLVVNSSPQF
jgi:hypothetical protein